RWLQLNEWRHADAKSAFLLLASICPFCGVLGYLTPKLVDEYAAGSPAAAGKAYALNVAGCILGPLFASYVLLPHVAERHALILMGAPFFVIYFIRPDGIRPMARRILGFAAAAALALSLFFSRSFEDSIFRFHKEAIVRRDYAASVLAYGKGREKFLQVNGIGMTALTPITKFMVHLPL